MSQISEINTILFLNIGPKLSSLFNTIVLLLKSSLNKTGLLREKLCLYLQEIYESLSMKMVIKQ